MAPQPAAGFRRWVLLVVVVLHFTLGVVVGVGLLSADGDDSGAGVALLSRDDVANVAMAYSLAHGEPAVLPEQPPYGFLYPAMLAPAYSVGFEESGVVVWAQVLNAAIGAATVLALYGTGRAFYPALASPSRVLVGAVVAGSMPSVWLYGSIAWPERLLALGVAVVALILARIERAPASASLRPVGAIVAVSAVHPRGSIVAVVALIGVGLICESSARRMIRAGLVAVGLVEVVRRIVQSGAFESEGSYDVVQIAQRRALSDVDDMILKGLGTVAALIIASCGLALLGVATLWRSGRAGQTTVVIGAVTVAVSGVFLAGVTTADSWLYGRYIESVAGPVILAGVIDPFGWLRRPMVVAATSLGFVATAVVASASRGEFADGARSKTMMIGAEVFGAWNGADQFRPLVAVAVSAGLGLGLWLIACLDTRAAAAALVLALVAGVSSAQATRHDIWTDSAARAVQLMELPESGTVSLDGAGPPIASASAAAFAVGFDRLVQVGAEAEYLILANGGEPPTDAARVSDGAGLTVWLLP